MNHRKELVQLASSADGLRVFKIGSSKKRPNSQPCTYPGEIVKQEQYVEKVVLRTEQKQRDVDLLQLAQQMSWEGSCLMCFCNRI